MTATIEQLEAKALAGNSVSVDEFASAIAKKDAAERLAALQQEGEAKRNAEQRNADAATELLEVEKTLTEHINDDSREVLVTEIETLFAKYEQSRSLAATRFDDIRTRLYELKKSYPEVGLDFEIANGEIRIHETRAGSVSKSVGTKESGIQKRLSVIASKLPKEKEAMRVN